MGADVLTITLNVLGAMGVSLFGTGSLPGMS
jgi:hypothetical protein